MTIAIPDCIFFCVRFAVILAGFSRHFARFWKSVWKPDVSVRMVFGARQNAQFSSLFEAFLTPQKSSASYCFADFLKKRAKLDREKVNDFGAIHILRIDFMRP